MMLRDCMKAASKVEFTLYRFNPYDAGFIVANAVLKLYRPEEIETFLKYLNKYLGRVNDES